MKTKIIGVAALMFGLGAWVWTACDKIPDDEMRIASDLPEWQGKTVVLEDFTGVGCVNCPNAAEIAHGLQTLMGDKLIVVELHPDNTSQLSSLTAPLAEGDADLRSAMATTYATFWKVEGLPAGLINRQQASGETVQRGRWRGQAISVYGEVPVATVEATASLSGSSIAVSASGAFSQAYTAEEGLHVLVMVLEDGFAVTQRTPGGDQAGYAHNHVLRAVVGDVWGNKVLDAGAIASGTAFTYTGNVGVDAAWKTANLSVAVLLCDAKTKEILNAAKVQLN